MFFSPINIAPAILGSAYDSDAQLLFDSMSVQPDDTRKALINTFIVGLKSAGYWTKLDALYVLGAHDAQAARVNWVNPALSLTTVNSPTFTTDRGYAGDGATSYLSFAMNVSDYTKYLQDDAHIGIYCNLGVGASTTRVDIGASNGVNASVFMRAYNSGVGDVSFRSNSFTSTSATTVTDETGHTVIVRSSSTAQAAYKNGAALSTFTQTSTGRPAFPLFVGAVNSAGSPASFSSRRYAAVHVGSQLSAGEASGFYTLLLTYLTAIGAN